MNMLTFQLDRLKDTPLYEQLYQFIKKEIICERLKYGTKLPSMRRLADDLKISRNTVDTAYNQLVAEGYIKNIERRGFFVLNLESLEYVTKDTPVLESDHQKIEEWIYQFLPGHVDTEQFPFEKWRKYARKTIDESKHSLLLVGDMQGEYVLRKEIAHYLYHARGIVSTPEQIIVGAGVEMLLQQLILLFGNTAVYGVEDPGYHAISHLLKHHPNAVQPLHVDEKGLKVQQLLHTDVNIIYVTPSHHFPYGSVLSANRRIQLLNWAREKPDHYIIEDDYDSEFRYNGKRIPSLQSMDQSEKVIYLGSFSKTLIPSLRISYMMLPKNLLQLYKGKFSFYQCAVSRMDQHILAKFMKEGHFGRHLNRMRTLYQRKRDIVLQILKPYENKIKVIGAQSGLHIVLQITNGMSEKQLIERAKQKRIEIYPLSRYAIQQKESTSTQLILGFAGIPEKELKQSLHMLLNCWDLS